MRVVGEVQKELKQIHNFKKYKPLDVSKCTSEEKRKAVHHLCSSPRKDAEELKPENVLKAGNNENT